MEKAAELVGLEPKTVAGWVGKRRAFGERIKKARREHELSLLRDIELAGAKSWQAKAWMAERVYNYAQPSARLQVAGEVQHGINSGLAQMLAGIATRKARQAQVVDISTDTKGTLQICDKSKTSTHLSGNGYCINKQPLIDNDLQKVERKLPKVRHKQMRRRKPGQSKAKGDDTPMASPPPPIHTHNTP